MLLDYVVNRNRTLITGTGQRASGARVKFLLVMSARVIDRHWPAESGRRLAQLDIEAILPVRFERGGPVKDPAIQSKIVLPC